MSDYQSAFTFTAMPCFTTAAQMCPTRSVTRDFRLSDKEREKNNHKSTKYIKKNLDHKLPPVYDEKESGTFECFRADCLTHVDFR